jgi:hypothetical protein
LWPLVHYALCHRFDYWVQHCLPDVVEEAAAKVDASVLRLCGTALGQNFTAPGAALACKRLRLPARSKGGGIRSHVASSRATFVGALSSVLETFLDRTDELGVVHKGLYTAQLAGLFGAGAFDAGAAAEPLSDWLASDCPFAAGFSAAWAGLRAAAGSFACVLLAAPDGALRLRQKTLTEEVEKEKVVELTAEFEALGRNARSRQLWSQLDSFSSAWVTMWPLAPGDARNFTGAEFYEVAAQYFFLPSPGLAAHVGETIAFNSRWGRKEVPCDEFGDTLQNASLPGGGHSIYHDAAKLEVLEIAREMGLRAQPEVHTLFRDAVPPARRANLKKQVRGMIPDLMIALPVDGRGTVTEDTLLEVKTITFTPQSAAYAGARRATPVSGVRQRATGLETQTVRDLRRRDREWCGTQEGATGPLLARFRSFAKLRGLVFGALGEASPDVHKLLGVLAYTGAEAHGLAAGGTTTKAATGALAWQLKRRLARVVLKSRAKLLLDRRCFIGPGAPTAGDGRTNAPRAAGPRAFSQREHERGRWQQRSARGDYYNGCA